MADIGQDEDARRIAELEKARRDLRVSMALAAPGSPVVLPILAQMEAIDRELAARTAGGPVRLCSCGFATDDPEWLQGHLFDHPGHDERGRLLRLPVAPQMPDGA